MHYATLTTTGQRVIVTNHIVRYGYYLVYVPYTTTELLNRRTTNNNVWHSARLISKHKIELEKPKDVKAIIQKAA